MFTKLYLLLAFVLACVLAGIFSGVLVGCSCDNAEQWNDSGRIYRIVGIDRNFNIYCDRKTNIAYLELQCGYRGGITPYLNADGNPTKCNEVQR